MKSYHWITLFFGALLAQSALATNNFDIAISAEAEATYDDVAKIMAKTDAAYTIIKDHDKGLDTRIDHAPSRHLKKALRGHGTQEEALVEDNTGNRQLGGRTCPGDSWYECFRSRGTYFCILHCWDIYDHRSLSDNDETSSMYSHSLEEEQKLLDSLKDLDLDFDISKFVNAFLVASDD